MTQDVGSPTMTGWESRRGGGDRGGAGGGFSRGAGGGRGPRRLSAVLKALIVIAALGLGGVSYWWFVQRVEVPAGSVLVLVRKVGETLPAESRDGTPLPASVRDQVLLYPELLHVLGEPPGSTRYKGIAYEVKPEGRYFFDPFLWERIIVPAVVIGPDEVGIKIRRYGTALPEGKLVATLPDERGPLADVLTPGRHNINPYAYDVKRVPVVTIKPGFVGVQRLLHGDVPQNPNSWVVQAGEHGVQPDVLPPARYYNNPYVRRIDPIDVTTRILDLNEENAIRFPSNDSFEIVIDVRIEYAVRQDLAPYVLTAIGDHDDIEDKLIRPYTRSLARIEGSKMRGRDFISGEGRVSLGERVLQELREQCWAQGIEIRDAKFRKIIPPQDLEGPISDRQLAEQQISQFRQEIGKAKSEAELVEQEELQKQNQAIGEVNRTVVVKVTAAQQDAAVALTDANKRLEVAKLALEAAKQNAEAILARGRADAEVVKLNYEAEARPLRDAVSAFGDGDTYAQYFFMEKLGGSIQSILTTTDGPLGDILRALAAQTPSSATPKRPPAQARNAPEEHGDAKQAAHIAPATEGGDQ